MKIGVGVGLSYPNNNIVKKEVASEPIFALNFDNFAYKAVDYPEFATGKVTTNKIVIDSTTEIFNGTIAAAMNPEADTGDPIEVPAYKLKISGMDAYNMPEDFYFIAVLGKNISGKPTEQWVQQFSKDGIYNIPAITLEDNIYNISISAMIGLDKPIEIEVLYDKNITKSFPENKQIIPISNKAEEILRSSRRR